MDMPNVSEAKMEVSRIFPDLKNYKIQSKEDAIKVRDTFKHASTRIKEWQAKFKPLKDAAHATHKKICSLEKEAIDAYTSIKELSGQILERYDTEQRAIIEAEAARIRKEAEEAALIESERLRKVQEEERLRLATQLEQQGYLEEADAVIAQNVSTPVVIPETSNLPKLEKMTGISIRTTYSVEVYDLMSLVKAVAEGREPLAFLMANESMLNKHASNLKEEFKMTGVRLIKTRKTGG